MKLIRKLGPIALVASVLGIVEPTATATTVAVTEAAPNYLQVVAHADDDLLFMNPDLQNAINAGGGRTLTTVYLTAGEGNYRPAAESDIPSAIPRDCQATVLKREEYAYCRAEGARRAWMKMLKAPVGTTWNRSVLSVPLDGTAVRQVELDTAVNALGVTANLVFVNLPDDADKSPSTKVNPTDPTASDHSLTYLWNKGSSRATVVPSGSMVTFSQSYSKNDLIGLLGGLLRKFKPTVVGTQDPVPDARYPYWGYTAGDHPDHVVAALATGEALKQTMPSTRVQSIHYRDYDTLFSEANLSPATSIRKRSVWNAYTPFDQSSDIKYEPAYPAWITRQFPRFWRGTNWVGRNQNGTLQAFSVQGGRLLSWSESSEGVWSRPSWTGDPDIMLAPGVSVTRNADGRLLVSALSLETGEIVTLSQISANSREWGDRWTSLGRPSAQSGPIGQPVTAINSDGRIQVFVKNSTGGVSTTAQIIPNGPFSDWSTVDTGTGVQDGLAAATDSSGRIQLFAYSYTNTLSERLPTATGSILNWRQNAPGSTTFTKQPFPFREPSGPPTVAKNEDGRLDVFYRTTALVATTTLQATDAGNVEHTWQKSDGSWSGTTQSLGGHDGIGPVAAVSAGNQNSVSTVYKNNRIMLFEHNAVGGVSKLEQRYPNQGYRDWFSMGNFLVGEPAAAADRHGRILVFMVGDDGKLRIAKQPESGDADQPFTPWTLVKED